MGRNHLLTHRIVQGARGQSGGAGFALTTVVILIALTAAVVLGFRHSIALADRLDREAEQHLVANYLDRQAQESIARQKVQLTWDDAFRAVGGHVDTAWADNYLGRFLWLNFRLDRMYLVTPDGTPRRAWSDGVPLDHAGMGSLAPLVQQRLSAMTNNSQVFGTVASQRKIGDTTWPFDADGHAMTRWSSALLSVDGRPAQITIASIVPDTDMGLMRRTPNHLVAVKFLDEPVLAAMERGLLLQGMTIGSGPAAGSSANSFALSDPDGAVIGWLNWETGARASLIQSRMRPLFLGYVCMVTALILGWAGLLRRLAGALGQVEQSEKRALQQARHDTMTGLPNRVHFLDRLARQLAEFRVRSDGAVLLAYFDLDNFKFINDTLGHPLGDELVRAVARRCSERLPANDFLARLGGDEFVLMRCCDREEGSVAALGRELMAIFETPFCVDGREIDVTVSCGISWAPVQGRTAEELLRKADIALFRAKQRGRARWRAFSDEMAQSVSRRLELETELRKALKADRLELAYQPIVEAREGHIVGAEALLRWDHPDFGMISPSLFVPVAEQSGIMSQLGWWTIRRVFAERRQWPDLDVSVNLSPLQLTARGFADQLGALAREMKVDTARITFEVTEGAMMERGGNAFEVLRSMRGLGFGLALDDFGTGYSSLGYLRAFRFDRLKIDRTFIQNIEDDADAQSILRAIIGLARGLDIRTVAEGVETTAQRDLVVAAGCQMIQGFFHHAPVRADGITALLERERREDLRVVPLRSAS